MTPQEKLAEIEYESKRHLVLEEIYGQRPIDWLIARVKQLEKTLERLSRNFTPMIKDPCCKKMKDDIYELEVRKLWCDEALTTMPEGE